VVICPLHNYTYDLTTGCEVSNGGAGVPAYSARVDGAGEIRLSTTPISTPDGAATCR
jgi:nitrite reductase (NADH) small subunit